MALKKAKAQKGVFVIMPFVQTPTRDQNQLTSFFKNNIKQPIEAASLDCEYRVWRSGETFNITDEIIRDLFGADIVIADLSGEYPNPNVMYELGVRLALSDKPVILIREKNPNNQKVFDVDSYYIHAYDPLRYSDLEKHLLEKLRRFETGEEQFESPVKEVLHDELILSQSSLSTLSPQQQRDIVLLGARLIERNVSFSYGPLGSGIPVTDRSGDHALAKRALEISKATWSSNPLENRGIDLLSEVARNVIDKIGDGSKTGILLAFEMMEAGNEALKQGYLPKRILRGMEKAVKEVADHIELNSRLLKEQKEVANIAATSAKDQTTGQIIAESLAKVGKHGIVLFEKSDSNETEIEVIEGIQFDRGYLSTDFVTKPGTSSWVFKDCSILLYPKVIANHTEVIPLLEKIANSKSPLLIIAEDVRDEALDTLILNVQEGIIQCVAVKLPEHGNRAMEVLDDIAIKTGGKIISSAHGLNLANIELSDLGKAEKVIVTGEYTRIIGGKGDLDQIEARIKKIYQKSETTKSSYDAEKYQERIAMLIGAIAVVHVGGVTSQEINEKMYGFGSAINSAVAAISYGAVAGGGLTLYRARDAISKITAENDEEAAGIAAVARSLEAPIRRLIQNANLNPAHVLDAIDTSQMANIGLNVENGSIEDLVESGILDPTALLKTALQVAYSYSRMFLESASWANPKIENVET